jgi:DNA-directed RNA polymerase subunit M/transcription elongation factor TFIIS
MPEQQQLFDIEEFAESESAAGDLSDDESPAAFYDPVTCPKCESENINFNGMTRAAYMPRTIPYTCRDCGHSFTEDEYQESL